MPSQHVVLGRLVEEVLRTTTLGRALATVSGEPFEDSHRQWLSSMCMLGAVSGDPQDRLGCVLRAADGSGPLGGWFPPEMPETNDRLHLLNAIMARTGRGVFIDQLGPRSSNTVIAQEIEVVAEEMARAGRGRPWRGVVPIRRPRDGRGLVHSLIAGVVSMLHPIAIEDGDGEDTLRRAGLIRDTAWLDGVTIEDCDPMDPCFAILEAEPSWAKVREAIAHGIRLWRQGVVEGITWLFPTRRAARHVFVQLLALLPQVPIVLALWQEEDTRDGHWFLERRHRNFAAPICISTLEHGYKAIREAEPHSFTHATWMARNLLIVDGLTPADTRNLAAASALVRNHLRRGSSALVVTSALDQRSRQVIEMFTHDVFGPLPPNPPNLLAHAQPPFPPFGAVWTRPVPNVPLQARPLPARNTQVIRVNAIPAEEHEDNIREAVRLARLGQRVGIVLTTNLRCHNTARHILDDLHGDDVMLHAGLPGYRSPVTYRSRYFSSDLHCIDDAVRAEFDVSRRRNGCLLVATGLIDHSIDASFDLVLTDLEPFDILLRRMALLSRGGASCWRPRPELRVLIPDMANVPATRIYRNDEALQRTNGVLDQIEADDDGDFTFATTRERLEAVYLQMVPVLTENIARARGLCPHTEPFGVNPANDPMRMQAEPRMPMSLPPGTFTALGFDQTGAVFYARRDAQFQDWRPVALNPAHGLNEVRWDGDFHHVYDSLGYRIEDPNPDEDANDNDVEE